MYQKHQKKKLHVQRGQAIESVSRTKLNQFQIENAKNSFSSLVYPRAFKQTLLLLYMCVLFCSLIHDFIYW